MSLFQMWTWFVALSLFLTLRGSYYVQAASLALHLRNVGFRSFSQNYGLMTDLCLSPIRVAVAEAFDRPEQSVEFSQIRPVGSDETQLLFSITGDDVSDFPSLLSRWTAHLTSSSPTSLQSLHCGLTLAEVDTSVSQVDEGEAVQRPPLSEDEVRMKRRESLEGRERTMNLRLKGVDYDDFLQDITLQQSLYSSIRSAAASVLGSAPSDVYVTDVRRGSTEFRFSYYNSDDPDSEAKESSEYFPLWGSAIANKDPLVQTALPADTVDFEAPSVVNKGDSGSVIPTEPPPSGSIPDEDEGEEEEDKNWEVWHFILIALASVVIIVTIGITGVVCCAKSSQSVKSSPSTSAATVTPRTLEGQYE